jgi:hypothetical protein
MHTRQPNCIHLPAAATAAAAAAAAASWSISGVLSKAKESVQKIIGSSSDSATTTLDGQNSDDAAAAANEEEEEPPLPYEEPAPEEGDVDEPDWSMNDGAVNSDPDYEPFDGEHCIEIVLQ